MPWFGDPVKRVVHDRAADGLYEVAEHLLETANQTVPLQDGDLQRSGVVDIDRSALRATVSYDTPYAVKQHEDLNLRHAPKRRAKWLELALKERRPAMQARIAAKIRGAF